MFLLLLACPPAADSGACTLSARPPAAPVAGDGNGDGVADLADGIAVEDDQFRRGTSLTCPEAVDLFHYGDGTIDAGVGPALWYWLYAGTSAAPTYTSGTCSTPTRSKAPCGDGLAWSFSGDSTAKGNLSVTLSLTTGGLSVEGFSTSIQAKGCTVTAITTDGTSSADLRDGGLRDGGFVRLDPSTNGGAAGAVVYGLDRDASLPPSSKAASVLVLSLSAPACGTCTLQTVDGEKGKGQPVINMVASGGLAYVPAAASFSAQLCP